MGGLESKLEKLEGCSISQGQVSVPIRREVYEKLRKIAEVEGISIDEAATKAVKMFLEHLRKEP